MRRVIGRRAWGVIAAVTMVSSIACETELDERGFQRKAERIFADVNPGFGIMRRVGMVSTFVRGDQIYELDAGPLYAKYKLSGVSGSKYLDGWQAQLEADAKARRKTMEQARASIVPIIKSGSWIRVQDLGAIGPRSEIDKIRPWRKEVANDVFALLAVPEELLGFRYVSIHEMGASKATGDEWIATAVANLVGQVGTSTGAELRNKDGKMLVWEVVEVDNVAALLLDEKFRGRMLTKFGEEVLGAAIPNRDVLIVFEAADFVTIKPIRARTHELYDVRNHPGFRGLLRFDRNSITVLESAHPDKDKKKQLEKKKTLQ